MKQTVFAVAPYLNSAPLIEGLHAREDVKELHDVPSALGALVQSGRADVGLMPIVDHFLDPDLTTIDGLGVCAAGRVRSVFLRCRCGLDEVKTVAADPASHTSNLLAQLVLRCRFGSEPRVEDDRSVDTADAEVIIGDKALAAEMVEGRDYDLAEEWQKMTELPFVFAAWTYRRDHPRAADFSPIARESLNAGLAVRDDIALRYARRLSIPVSICREYLESHVYYEMGDAERRGIAEFSKLLREYALIPEEREYSLHAV